MQPNIVTADGASYRIFTDENNINFPAASIDTYALRRVFNLAENTSKTIDFTDLTGYWAIDSFYISSPLDSDVKVEMFNDGEIAFYTDLFRKSTTPRSLPTVLINNNLTMKLTAKRSPINLLLIYLKPAHLAYSKDF